VKVDNTQSRNCIQILHVEDNVGDNEVLDELIRWSGGDSFEVVRAETLREARQMLGDLEIDVVLLDLNLPDSRGLSTVDAINKSAPDVPIIVCSGQGDEATALQAIQAQAQDYIVKWDLDGTMLVTLIRHTIERHRLRRQLSAKETRLRDVVRELELANERLAQLVTHDPLTHVLNRRGFDQVLDHEVPIARRTGAPMAAALVDCDDFKAINDRYGHSVGDAVLYEVANRIEEALRTTDHVARIGGDEFLVLLPDSTALEAVRVAERIRLRVRSTPCAVSPAEIRVTVSTGVSPITLEEDAALESILGVCRVALARSKRAGKDNVTSGEYLSVDFAANEPNIGDALCSPDAYRVVAQPILRLVDEAIVGYELLSRSLVPGFESPTDFFALAVEQHLLSAVDLCCLGVCMRAAQKLGPGIAAHVNLFPSTILSTPPETLVEMLSTASGPRPVCLEISEQQGVSDPMELRDRLSHLQAAGIRVALDDLGFGRSSLELLVSLEPDLVKVDPQLVEGAANSHARAGALRRLVALVRAIDTDMVAEGIDSRDDLALVRSLGITFGQGFLWGRPEE